MNGKIKWYKREKGYGFITGDDGKDYFVHYSKLPQDQEDVKDTDNVDVSFEVKDTDRGTQAVDVKFLDKAANTEEPVDDATSEE